VQWRKQNPLLPQLGSGKPILRSPCGGYPPPGLDAVAADFAANGKGEIAPELPGRHAGMWPVEYA
jgi:hypothetical protein